MQCSWLGTYWLRRLLRCELCLEEFDFSILLGELLFHFLQFVCVALQTRLLTTIRVFNRSATQNRVTFFGRLTLCNRFLCRLGRQGPEEAVLLNGCRCSRCFGLRNSVEWASQSTTIWLLGFSLADLKWWRAYLGWRCREAETVAWRRRHIARPRVLIFAHDWFLKRAIKRQLIQGLANVRVCMSRSSLQGVEPSSQPILG
ncbi:hypothetical protein B7H18_03920 [Pseudomonas putida]|uniref:Uncharacterized protein n=1 Tax=Pseudomonas putida TaxID=303 RepID=A0A1X1A5C9_PSEPU|nr:hypothetical protein B7H18_03920 [Pseudomonas putida]ORL58870.1 hypothetical protein B7H17_25435 [Pseudomonas putida]ORL67123.1 hypothetical protein B7H19_18865 [Pseudomonas putida]PLP92033.1 hypothetical protein CX682_08735 [Pseudomonas sp. FFUP_PS_41]